MLAILVGLVPQLIAAAPTILELVKDGFAAYAAVQQVDPQVGDKIKSLAEGFFPDMKTMSDDQPEKAAALNAVAAHLLNLQTTDDPSMEFYRKAMADRLATVQ